MITASIIPAEQRINFLPSITKTYVYFEQSIYHFFNQFCKESSVDYWEYVQLSNGGKFLFPRATEQVRLINTFNHSEVTLPHKASGICITLFALRHYSMLAYQHSDMSETHRLTKLYDLLLDYARQQEDADLIDRFIH